MTAQKLFFVRQQKLSYHNVLLDKQAKAVERGRSRERESGEQSGADYKQLKYAKYKQ